MISESLGTLFVGSWILQIQCREILWPILCLYTVLVGSQERLCTVSRPEMQHACEHRLTGPYGLLMNLSPSGRLRSVSERAQNVEPVQEFRGKMLPSSKRQNRCKRLREAAAIQAALKIGI